MTATNSAFIYSPGNHYIENAYDSEASAAAALPEIQAREPARSFVISCDWDAFTAAAEAKFMTPAIAINSAQFMNALECLPPMQWHRAGNIELFCMSEITFGMITTQYAKQGTRYLCKPVRFNDRDTYISAADFDATPDPQIPSAVASDLLDTISPCEDSNLRRAARAFKTLWPEYSDDDFQTGLQDLLCDLRHLADAAQISFESCDAGAKNTHSGERADCGKAVCAELAQAIAFHLS